MSSSGASAQRHFVLRFVAFAVPMFALYTFPYDPAGPIAHLFERYLSGYAHLAGAALALIEPGIRVSGQDINGRFGLRIIQSCDAIEAVILFAAAVLAFPVAWWRRSIGLALGTLGIVTLNVARICNLYFVGVYQPTRFEFYHLEVWPLVLVAAAGLGFLVWTHWATRLQAPV